MFKRLLLLKLILYALVIGAVVYTGSHFLGKLQIAMKGLPDLLSEDIEDRFRAYATRITGKQSLYVAKLEQVEVFERTSRAKALWFELPKVVVGASAPVEYNYFVTLSANWSFQLDENVLVVHVPELSSSTPAVNIAKLKIDVKKGSLLRTQSEVLKRFEQELPGMLVDRAIAHRELVREQARESVALFVQTWVQGAVGVKEGSYSVRILFPGEKYSELSTPR